MKFFFHNINVVNIFILMTAIAMVNYLVLPLLSAQMPYTLPSQESPVKAAEEEHTEFSPPFPADYAIISEANLFHPERLIPPEKKVEQELPKPDFVLYGTMVSDEFSLAFLEDLKAPRNTPGRGKRQVALKKGDTFSGFILKEIEQDKIIMVRGEEKMSVSLVDPQKPKTRESIAPVSQQVPVQPAQQLQKSSPALPQPKRQTLAPGTAGKQTQPGPSATPLPPVDEKIRQFMGK